MVMSVSLLSPVMAPENFPLGRTEVGQMRIKLTSVQMNWHC